MPSPTLSRGAVKMTQLKMKILPAMALCTLMTTACQNNYNQAHQNPHHQGYSAYQQSHYGYQQGYNGYPQVGYPQAGYSQAGYSQAGYPQAGVPIGAYAGQPSFPNYNGQGNYRPVDVNYDLSAPFEAPVAFDVGGTTLALRGRLDAPIGYSFRTDDIVLKNPVVNHQISLERQLPNRITVGAVYGGSFEDIGSKNNSYSDNVAAFAGGSWGTVFGGNVSDLVFEETRRARNVGIVQLAGNGALGELNRWSGGYRGRFGPAIVSGVVDEDANYDVGVSWQRPIGVKDYRFTARHNQGQLLAADGITELDTKSVSGVAEYVYGSSRFDVGAGIEKIEDADRWFTAAGLSTKVGAWGFSAEGQYGEIEGQEETAGILTVRKDLARGLAATVALDHRDAQVAVDGIQFLDDKDTRLIAALSYGF